MKTLEAELRQADKELAARVTTESAARDSALKAASAEIATLRDSLQAASGERARTEARFAELSSALAALKAGLAQVETAHGGDRAKAERALGALETSLGERLRRAESSLETGLRALDRNQAKAEAELTGLSRYLTDLKAEVVALRAKVDQVGASAHQGLGDRLGRIERLLEKLGEGKSEGSEGELR